jgi:hypothetical protein
MFLPHTGFLLGKLIKMANKVSSYSYVEEGQYSSTKRFGFLSHRDVNCDELLEQLKSNDILEQMGISEADVMKVNQINNFFLDSEHSKYRASYSLSDDAFLGFSDRRQFHIDIPQKRIINFKRTTLVVLPPLFPLWNNNRRKCENVREKIFSLISSSNTYKRTEKLVFKIHPQDYFWCQNDNLFSKYIQMFRMMGSIFNEIEIPIHLDPNIELSFLGFEYYLIFNESSVIKYLDLFISKVDKEIILLNEINF